MARFSPITSPSGAAALRAAGLESTPRTHFGASCCVCCPRLTQFPTEIPAALSSHKHTFPTVSDGVL